MQKIIFYCHTRCGGVLFFNLTLQYIIIPTRIIETRKPYRDVDLQSCPIIPDWGNSEKFP